METGGGGGGGGILLVATAMLLLRPSDVPKFARAAGRVCGASIHSLRAFRHTIDRTLKEGRSVAGVEGGEISKMRDELSESLSKFDKVAASFRQDIASVPLSPRDILRKQFKGTVANTAHNNSPGRVNRSVPHAAVGAVSPQPTSPISLRNSPGRTSSGADFIARAIEEEALARQQEILFGAPDQSAAKPEHHKS